MNRLLRYCTYHGCPNKVERGRCPQHRRATAYQSGYTPAWSRYSKQRLAQHPWCVGYPTGYHGAYRVLATCTDHIISAHQRPDRFWDPSNHQSLCARCNTVKAIECEGGFGR